MATTTPNIGLVKPAQTDFYDIDEFYNPNMDTLDKAVGDLQTEISGLEGSAERIANLEKTAVRQNTTVQAGYSTVLEWALAQDNSVTATAASGSPLVTAPDSPAAPYDIQYFLQIGYDSRRTITAHRYVGNKFYLRSIYQGKWYGDWEEIGKTPPGTIIYAVTSEAPAGYLKANGGTLYISDFPDLWAVLGNRFGGDGVTTFRLPDLRGYFVRSLDEGAGRDIGRTLASTQGDAIRNIYGAFSGNLMDTSTGVTGAFAVEDTSAIQRGTNTNIYNNTLSFDASRQVPTAAENRPINIALLACIKY